MNRYTQAIEPGWQNTQFCFLNEKALKRVSRRLAAKKFETPDWRAPVFPQEDDKTFIDFLGVANAINYCFTDLVNGQKFTVEYPADSGILWQGAFAMFASLRRALENGIPILDRDFLSRPRTWYQQEQENFDEKVLTIGYAISIFASHGERIPMIASRVASLRSYALTMQQLRVRCMSELFERCDYYAFEHEGKNGIVDLLASSFSQYYDVQVDKNQNVLPFHKRAQLLVMMYHGRAISSDGALEPIRDAHLIGPLADYQVPNALRTEGIFQYSDTLARVVDAGCIIQKNSEMEIEIRAQTVHAMARLLEEINALRRRWHKKLITMVELDYTIWRRGREATLKHHRTYTTAY